MVLDKRLYLDRMGIDCWTLRCHATLALPSCYGYQLFCQDQRVAVLLAQAATPDVAIETLLQKMITAIKCRGQGQWYPLQPQCEQMDDIRFVIALGELLVIDEFAPLPVITSYAPQQLMATPQLKAETWRSLQRVFSYLPPDYLSN